MARCPAYGGPICSLCCSLDARCGDLCKPEAARAGLQFKALLRRLTPRAWWPQLDTGLGRYLLLMACVAPALAGLLALLYQAELRQLTARDLASAGPALRAAFVKAYCALLLVGGVIGWWLVAGGWCWRRAAAAWRRKNATVRRIRWCRRSPRTRAPTTNCSAPSSRPRPLEIRPTPPTRPRRATSAPSATSCARR